MSRELVEIDGHLLAVASGFVSVELSPVAPLGMCATARSPTNTGC